MSRTSKHSILEWEGSGMPEAPQAPKNLKESGLSLGFLNDLLIRTLYVRGTMLGLELARSCCLPFNVIDESLKFLKNEKCIEVGGGDSVGRVSYRFSLTELGRRRAQDAMEMCKYTGPAPVPIEDYIEQTYRQAVTGITCTPELLRSPFSHLVLKEELFNAIGPAIVSGKSVFVYGPPGTGKTSVARSIGEFMNSQGGEIFVPYAFLAESAVITVYDQAVHHMGDSSGSDRLEDSQAVYERLMGGGNDERWVRIRRPVIVTGGELTLDMLDLRFNASANFYQAPLHVKANGGVFLIDDFGRQLVSPKELLNRWILPLEDRHDYLTLASGKKFEVPFEQLIIFSTNLDPRKLVDDAFLRRMRHKVEVGSPPREVYERIFAANCKRLGMTPLPEAIQFLYDTYYDKGRTVRASDCRDLLEIVQSICRFRRQPVQLSLDLIRDSATTFIGEF